MEIGCVYPRKEDASMEARGRNLETGLPVTIKIKSSEIMEALIEPAMQIVDAVKGVLEKTPPELTADISDRGIYMTGGGSLLYGLDKLFARNNRNKCNDCTRCYIMCCNRHR